MKKMKLAAISALCMVPAMFLSNESSAVPAWSRKYQVSCYMCHSGFPTRNAVGEAFKNNGYRLPDGNDDAFTQQKNLKEGTPEWKKTIDAPFLGSLPQFDPLSLMVSGTIVNYKEGTKNALGATTEEQSLYQGGINAVSLWFGASVGDNLTIVGGLDGFGKADALGARVRAVWQFSPGFNLALGNAFSNSSFAQSFQGGVRNLSSVLPTPVTYAELNFTKGEQGGYSLVAGLSTNATAVNTSPAGPSNLDAPNPGNTFDDIRYLRGKIKLFGTGLLSGAGGEFGNSFNGMDNSVSIGAGVVSMKSALAAKGGLETGSFKGETLVYGADIQAYYNNFQLNVAASKDSDLKLNNVIVDAGWFVYPWLFAKLAYSDIRSASAPAAYREQPTIVPSLTAYLAPNIMVVGNYTAYLKEWNWDKAKSATATNANTMTLNAYIGF